MSHTASIASIKIQSITALRAAVAELAASGIKISLLENSTPRAYFKDQVGMGKAEFVLHLPDCRFDVGLYKVADGYEARTDWFGQHVERILGAPATSPASAEQARLGKFFQSYAINAAQEAARKQGHMTRRIVKDGGVVALEVTGPNL